MRGKGGICEQLGASLTLPEHIQNHGPFDAPGEKQLRAGAAWLPV